jgi:hypothetical protein
MNLTPPVPCLWQEIATPELTDQTLCVIAKLGTCECLVRGKAVTVCMGSPGGISAVVGISLTAPGGDYKRNEAKWEPIALPCVAEIG